MNVRLTALVLTVSACAPQAEVDDLEARLASLEARVEAVEKRGAPSATGAPSSADEAAADAVYKDVVSLAAAGKMVEAKARVDELFSRYGTTAAARGATKLRAELEVIGRRVSDPEVERWFVGGAGDVDLGEGTTYVVFFEQWCPHCRREVPKLQQTWEANRSRMKMLGLTKITRSSTEDKVASFIDDNGLTYPIAKETGAASRVFGVSGIPATAVVKDGVIVWRGHPSRLGDDILADIVGR